LGFLAVIPEILLQGFLLEDLYLLFLTINVKEKPSFLQGV